jgi:hypothetical protein
MEKDLLSLYRIKLHQSETGIELQLQLNVFSDQPDEQVAHGFGNFIQRNRPRRRFVRANHRQQLPNQARRLQSSFSDLFRIFPGPVGRAEHRHQQIAIQPNSDQHIVEIVRDSARQTAYRL